jgi:hypothetical protein
MNKPVKRDFSNMTLGQKQRHFVLMVAELIHYAYSRGYEFSFGDAFRDPRLHGEVGVKLGYGHAKSCHKLKLAIDLNLFADIDADGDLDYVSSGETSQYKELGEYWEAMGGTWGGRFNDANHFSIEHNGMK